MTEEMGSSGLMRLPQYCRALLGTFEAQSALRTQTYPDLVSKSNETSDLWLAFAIASILFASRFIMHNYVLAGLLRDRSEKDRSKLSEALFYTAYYTAAFAYFLVYVVGNEAFLQEWTLLTNEPIVRNIFDPYPPPRSEFVQIFYMQALGFYASALVFLVAFDTRRKDFLQLLLHHIVTVSLLAISYVYSYTRVGALIVALHDFGDIFLYGATALNKLGCAGADTAVFAMFAATFAVTRLVVLPRLVHGVLIESLEMVVSHPTFNGWGMYFETALMHWGAFFVMLNTLILLHCFWFTLILRMIYREVFLGKKITDEGDIREYSDDE
jgi:hypothetical protein